MRQPCAFIDLTKAFDSIYRNALWYKLFKIGFDGKILKIFQAMYCILLFSHVLDIVTHIMTFLKFQSVYVRV